MQPFMPRSRCCAFWLSTTTASSIGRISHAGLANNPQPHTSNRPRLHAPQRFIERALPIPFQVQRDVVKSKWFENAGKAARHLRSKSPIQLLGCDLNANKVAMEPNPELRKSERANCLLADFDGLDVLRRHRRPIRNSRAKACRGWTVPCRESRATRQLPNFDFAQTGFHQGSLNLMLLRRGLPWAIIAQVVDVDTVDDMPHAAVASQ